MRRFSSLGIVLRLLNNWKTGEIARNRKYKVYALSPIVTGKAYDIRVLMSWWGRVNIKRAIEFYRIYTGLHVPLDILGLVFLAGKRG